MKFPMPTTYVDGIPVYEPYSGMMDGDHFTKPTIPSHVARTDDLGPPECELGTTHNPPGKEYASTEEAFMEIAGIDLRSEVANMGPLPSYDQVVENLRDMPPGSFVYCGDKMVKKVGDTCWIVGGKILQSVTDAASHALTRKIVPRLPADTKDEIFESLATGIAAITTLEEGDIVECKLRDPDETTADYFEDWLINPAPETIDTFPKKMKWLARLTAASRKWEAELKQINGKIDDLESYVLEEFALNGIERQTVGGFTFYPQKELWVNKKSEKDGVTTDMVCTALEKCGLGYMVKDGYAPSSLKSKVAEWIEEEHEVPDELKAVLNIKEGTKLIARKT